MIVPDVIEPIVGWRYWSLGDKGQLQSPLPSRESAWAPNQRKEAECEIIAMIQLCRQAADEVQHQESPATPERLAHQAMLEDPAFGEDPEWDDHQAPFENCGRGIHAAKDLDTLRGQLGSGQVVGEVYLWGKVIPGENGYRAQYAYPKSLRLVTKRALDHELVPLRAYCDDVGAMAPSEAWSPWWRRALNFIDSFWKHLRAWLP